MRQVDNLPPDSTIAVIGSGISGITAAYILSKKYNVSLFEASEKIGGHTNTFILQNGPDAGLAIDTGFIVFNYRNYPTLTKLLNILNVKSIPTDMSYSFYCHANRTGYGSKGLGAVFADKKNIFNPEFHKLIKEIVRFWSTAPMELKNSELEGLSVEQYLIRKNYSARFFRDYLSPFSAAIWSSPAQQISVFPVEMLVRFFINHGMISWKEQPQWRTIAGGSRTYLEKFKSVFNGEILTSKPVSGIQRKNGKVIVKTGGDEPFEFDGVFIATHADTALTLLEDASSAEVNALKPWAYEKNNTVLHCDTSFLPPVKKLVSAWNYVRPAIASNSDLLTVTYSMNILQDIKSATQYCVTLNPKSMPRDIIYSTTYTHPIYTVDSLRAQQSVPEIQGINNTWFCGSYCGFGFHEDGAKSAVNACRTLGLEF